MLTSNAQTIPSSLISETFLSCRGTAVSANLSALVEDGNVKRH